MREMTMADPSISGLEELSSSEKRCPYCAEFISCTAKKCKHCNEFVDEKSGKQNQWGKIVRVAGLLTAALSVFYPLREGYFYLQQKQQQREELSSYKQVAKYFESLDSLNYSQQALTKALTLAPSDIDLQHKLLILRAQELLREIEWSTYIQPQHQQVIEEMILDGYRLLQTNLADDARTQLLIVVARLLPHAQYWNDDDAISHLYTQAYTTHPADSEVLFRYGQWLVNAAIDAEKGIKLISLSVQLNPDDALYSHELARTLLAKGEFGLALPLLRRSINLLPKQRELQRIRASNYSKAELRKLLTEADRAQDISTGEFYGLNMQARQELIEQVLQDRRNDRSINFIAARFYFANQQYKLAEEAIRKSISEGDLKQIIRGYYLEQFELYRNILIKTGNNPEKLHEIQLAFTQYQETLSFEEALETGVEGEHRYKIGLRVEKKADRDSQEGLVVIKAYSGYPFAKAGVQEGDRVMMLAHRQVKSVLDIYRILSNFTAGTSLPLAIKRQNQQLEFELLVE
jgi:hypothetical protein